MERSKVLLTTLFSGYNYGSSLQAYATKTIIESLGYSCKLIARKSLIKGRDVRIGKLLTILIRTIVHFNLRTLKAYNDSYKKDLNSESVRKFVTFEMEYLKPQKLSWRSIKRLAKESTACVAGSDQLWDPTSLYVDPIYYLRFCEYEKRISFATSLGHDVISKENVRKIKKYITEIRSISVREESSVKFIKNLCNKDVRQLVDPTLLISGSSWREKFDIKGEKENYILAYFLDYPSSKALDILTKLRNELDCEVVAIPYVFADGNYAQKNISAGPIEFLSLVNSAKFVVTDSFHGMAFSINFHIPFYVFNRNYGSAHSQNCRILSLINKLELQGRYEPDRLCNTFMNVGYSKVERILEEERAKALDYLRTSLS